MRWIRPDEQVESGKDLYQASFIVAAITPGCTLLIAVMASIWQYKWIMRPLQSLPTWVPPGRSG